MQNIGNFIFHSTIAIPLLDAVRNELYPDIPEDSRMWLDVKQVTGKLIIQVQDAELDSEEKGYNENLINLIGELFSEIESYLDISKVCDINFLDKHGTVSVTVKGKVSWKLTAR